MFYYTFHTEMSERLIKHWYDRVRAFGFMSLLFLIPLTSQATTQLVLTDAEQGWLQNHPEITLAPDPEFRPIEFFDSQGLYEGLAADYVALVESRLGVRFNIRRLDSWHQALEQAKSRSIDMWGAASPTPQRREYMNFSDPLIEVPAAIIVRKQVTDDLRMSDLKGLRIAVIKGYAAHDYIVDRYPELTLDLVADVETALRKVSFGMADAMVGNLATATFYMEQEGISNLRIAGESGFTYSWAFAVRNDWPGMIPILNKALASITEEEHREIHNRWIGLGSSDWHLSRGQIYTAIVLLLFLFTLLAAWWNLSLKAKVRQKTQRLMHELEAHINVESELRLAAMVFNNTTEAIMITDDKRVILHVNPAFVTVTGYELHEVVGQTPEVLHSGLRGQTFDKRMWNILAEQGVWRGEVWSRTKDGIVFPMWGEIVATYDENSTVTHYIGSFIDTTQNKETETHVSCISHYDLLTGLPKRALFSERCEHALQRAAREGIHLAVLVLNLDHFKHINETLGHPAGDRILIEIASRLKKVLGEEITVSRLGGDEYAVLIEEIKAPEDAAQVATNMLDLFSTSLNVEGEELQLASSIGISVYPEDGADVNTLEKNADVAVYRAKQKGGNNYQFYTEELTERTNERLILEKGLLHALEEGELILNYQPIIDMTSKRPVCVEALVRWNHPELGLMSPDKFIPLAEETGLIDQLDEWVLYEACRQNKAWQDAGIPAVKISVNLSSSQLEKESPASTLVEVLKETGLEPKYLVLELKETTIMENLELMQEALNQIKVTGVTLSVDDFGTGFSALPQLKKLPFDTLKIDGSFIQRLVRDPEEAAIAKTIIAMAHTLSMSVVAEGVETESQALYLKRNSCDMMQGYYYAPPLAAEDCEKLLRENKQLVLTETTTENAQHPTVLIVDDDQDSLELLKILLSDTGYQLLLCKSAIEAFELLARQDVDVIVSDQYMPETDGIELLSQVKNLYPEAVRILLTAHPNMQSVNCAMNEGSIYKLITKPLETELVTKIIRGALEKRAVRIPK